MFESNHEKRFDSASEGQDNKKYSLLGVALTLMLVAAGFFSGFQIGTTSDDGASMEANVFSFFSSSPKATPNQDVSLDQFWRVWNLMEEKYVTEGEESLLSDEERIEGAINGLVASYNDPYSVYLPKVESEEFNQNISGNFGGVGMEVGMREGLITVIAPLPSTPAERSGILSGDVIVRIDDRSTERMSIDEAVRLIRGEKGTTVTLSIFRDGENELLEIDVLRDIISIPTIDTEIDGDVFIISLYSFNAVSEKLMQDALREYVQSGTKKMILDLRGNPGGFLQTANAISSFFLPTGKVILRENFGSGRSEVVYRSQGKVLHQFAPEEMVVLIDQGSASASEILAGALQEHGVATLIGETTFGKGSVQELVSLPGGSSLKVTVARWMTPNGRSISEGGLDPDITIERTAQDRIDEKDPQLEGALAWIRGQREQFEQVEQNEEPQTEEELEVE